MNYAFLFERSSWSLLLNVMFHLFQLREDAAIGIIRRINGANLMNKNKQKYNVLTI